MDPKGMFIAVSFQKDSGAPFYRLLIDHLQDQDTPVYGNNLTHFFTRGPIDFPDVERLDRALRTPDLILVLLSQEYLADDWLSREMDACLQLGRHRRDEGLVLLVPTGDIDLEKVPVWYRSHIKPGVQLRSGSQAEIKALRSHIGKLRRAKLTATPRHTSKKVFVIHGHDGAAASDIAHFLKEAGLEPVILHREVDGGITTVLAKFEKYANTEYAIVLLTPDDVAYARRDGPERTEYRARQNCLFEFGFFLSDIGHAHICCVCHEDVVLPSDIAGIMPKRFKKDVGEIRYSLLKELQAAGYDVAF